MSRSHRDLGLGRCLGARQEVADERDRHDRVLQLAQMVLQGDDRRHRIGHARIQNFAEEVRRWRERLPCEMRSACSVTTDAGQPTPKRAQAP